MSYLDRELRSGSGDSDEYIAGGEPGIVVAK